MHNYIYKCKTILQFSKDVHTENELSDFLFLLFFFLVLFRRRETREQSITVRGDHLGVRGADPDVELHGEPDIDADGAAAAAGGDRHRRAAAERRPHRLPRRLLCFRPADSSTGF